MKIFGFLFLFLMVIGTAACVYLGCSSKGISTSSNTSYDIVSITSKNAMASTVKCRKLKEEVAPSTGPANLNDYGLIDPVPSSMASIRPGPIQHGTPLMPYVPRSSPPPPTDRN